MNRRKDRLLAVLLAAAIILASAVSASAVPGAVLAAEPAGEGSMICDDGSAYDTAEVLSAEEYGEEISLPGSGDTSAESVDESGSTDAQATKEELANDDGTDTQTAKESEPLTDDDTDMQGVEEYGPVNDDDTDVQSVEENGPVNDDDTDTQTAEEPDIEHEVGEIEADLPAAEEINAVADALSDVPEPDWTKGGAGNRTDVSDQIQFTQDSVHWYTYSTRDYGTYNTASYTMKVDGKAVGFSVCMDPRKSGDRVTKSEKTYEITAPMLVKAVYYGAYGPGRSVVEGITGTTDVGANNIVTHVAVAEIYARLGYATKSKVGDGFIDTSAKLQEHVRKFVKAIEDLDVPSRYYLYISANSDGSKQDFGFGSTELVVHDASFTIEKIINEDDPTTLARIRSLAGYSLEGARYGIYRTKASADELRKQTPYKSLTVGRNGKTDKCVVPPGTYYIVEIKAPTGGGYIMSNTVHELTLSSGEVKELEAGENPKYVFLRIIKEPRNVPSGMTPPSLEGAVFNIYSNAKRTDEYLVGTLTTDADGKTEQLKKDLKGNDLLVQTYYVTEVTAPAGYIKAGNFTISTEPALEADARYTLIDRKVQESMYKAGITVYKKSTSPEETDDNKCYSLAGAKFGIYSDSACSQLVETIVTDEEGMAQSGAQLPAGDYWIREIEAPAGFNINDEVIKITEEDMTVSESQEITIPDIPKYDPARIAIVKRAAGGVKANSLAGARFTFSYYDGYYKSEAELPASPVRSWTIETKETGGEYVARIADCVQQGTFVSGDEFYLDSMGNPAFPLGTVTIRETEAPEGYLNDPDFGGGSEIMIGNIVLNSNGDAKFTVVQGSEPVENTLIVEETPLKPAIRTSAVDEKYRSRTVYAGEGSFRIIDTVTYENLNRNTDYILSGTLMDKATGKPFRVGGKDVTASTRFNTGSEMNGTKDVVFEFDCSEDDIKGHILVVKEELKADSTNEDHEHIPGAVHWDPEDKEQTICFPEIGTTLTEKNSKGHFVPADSDAVLIDTVTYKNLIPGEEYTLVGTLVDKATGTAVKIGGQEVSSTKPFTADGSNGSVDVNFTFSTKGLDGKALVAYEELIWDGRTIAKHAEADDQGQTVVVPGIKTDAYDKETGKKNSLSAKDRIIVDEVSYAGLISGKSYEISGEVRIRPESSEISFDDAPPVPSEIVDAKGEGSVSFDAQRVTFVPAGDEDEPVSGVIFVSYKVDTSDLAGKDIVVGETVRQNGAVIAVHRDINDERQADSIPAGRTIAVDTATGIKNTLAAENRVFKDTFQYENLIPGEIYRVTGKVMAGTGTDEEGNEHIEEIHSVMTDAGGIPVGNGYVEFVPSMKEGSLDLYFSIDATDLENREVTVFERVSLNGKPVIIHEVLDGTQTIYVPEGRTTAVDSQTLERISKPDEEACIIDTLAYRNLIPGKEYTVYGRVMRKTSGDEIASTITGASYAEGSSGSVSMTGSEVTFTPEQENGALELSFVFNASELAGEDTVIFERVRCGSAEVIVHENIDDERQTIHFPDGETKAVDSETGSHTAYADEEVTILDEVSYRNLLPGKTYTLKGSLMDKKTGKPIMSEGKEVNAVKQFIPETPDGSVIIPFTFDGMGLAGRSVVAFETVSYEGIDIFVHADLKDKDQTVDFPEISRPEPPAPPKSARTGDDSMTAMWSIAMIASIAGIGGLILYRKRCVR